MTRYAICPEPAVRHVDELRAFRVDPTDFISAGVLVSSADMVWVGVDPLPVGQSFNLRSWDAPVEREPGWHAFKGCPWVAHASNLVAFRIQADKEGWRA